MMLPTGAFIGRAVLDRCLVPMTEGDVESGKSMKLLSSNSATVMPPRQEHFAKYSIGGELMQGESPFACR